MRPLYESSTDREKEAATAKKITAMTGLSLVKNPPGYEQMDFSIVNRQNEIIGFLEVKVRNHVKGRFPDLFLSLHKYKLGVEYYNLLKIPFFVAFEFRDCIGIYCYSPTHHNIISFGGRTTNTRDQNDIEPVVRIPVGYVRTLEK